jgi:hypothetical protein
MSRGDRITLKEKALELREKLVTDQLVQLIEQRKYIAPLGDTGNIDPDPEYETRLIVLIEIAQRLTGNTEHFAVLVEFPRAENDASLRSVVTDRNGGPAENGQGRKDDPVLVGDAYSLQEPEQGAVGARVHRVRLYRLNEFLRGVREIPDFLSAVWIEAFLAWAGYGIDEYRELCQLPRRACLDESELPREVIEARAKVMGNIADEYTKTHRRMAVHLKAPDVIAILRIGLTGRGVRIGVQESVDLVPKRAKVFTCPVDFRSWPIHGGLHVS